jgi:hypothetical protein
MRKPLVLAAAVCGVIAISVVPGAWGDTVTAPAGDSQDSVTGSAKFESLGAHVIVDAHSGPAGEDPRGKFYLQQDAGDIQAWARVTCVFVSGNEAMLGGIVERASTPAIPVGTPLYQYVRDNGSPGTSDSSLTFVGGNPYLCNFLTAGLQVTSGNYVVHDATP